MLIAFCFPIAYQLGLRSATASRGHFTFRVTICIFWTRVFDPSLNSNRSFRRPLRWGRMQRGRIWEWTPAFMGAGMDINPSYSFLGGIRFPRVGHHRARRRLHWRGVLHPNVPGCVNIGHVWPVFDPIRAHLRARSLTDHIYHPSALYWPARALPMWDVTANPSTPPSARRTRLSSSASCVPQHADDYNGITWMWDLVLLVNVIVSCVVMGVRPRRNCLDDFGGDLSFFFWTVPVRFRRA
ncbi:hypothetical protein HD554DRAFT_1233619 [Boletus coccyginus]|nr:hypothetical protein HD554DRAFT_1233619 [Boletus coccyginus]